MSPLLAEGAGATVDIILVETKWKQVETYESAAIVN